jgi:hypothetical protein
MPADPKQVKALFLAAVEKTTPQERVNDFPAPKAAARKKSKIAGTLRFRPSH